MVILLIPAKWNVYSAAMDQGRFDLTTVDVDGHVIQLTGDWDLYPDGHFSPQEVASGLAGAPKPSGTFKAGEDHVGTYRAVFTVEAGKTYAISVRHQMLCERIYIDGELIGMVGNPGLTREESTPGIGYYLFSFAPASNEAEMLVQFSIFDVEYGMTLPTVLVSAEQTLLSYAGFKMFRDCFTLGIMLMVFVLFIAGYLFGGMKSSALHFSLAALAIGVHVLLRNRALIRVFQWQWDLTVIGEFLMMLLMVSALAGYIRKTYPEVFHRQVYWFLQIVTILYGCVILVTDTVIFPYLMLPYQSIVAAIGIYVLVRVIRPAFAQKTEGILFVAGFGLFLVFAVLDILYLNFIFLTSDFNLLQMGMVLFVCLHTAAMMVGLSRKDEALASARALEIEQRRANEMLLRLNMMKASFVATVSHEMRTPLTIISGHAEIVAKKMDEGATPKEDHLNRLETIASEANRLGDLVGSLLQVSKWMDSKDGRSVNLSDIVVRTARVYEPILEKKGNLLEVHVEARLPNIFANPDRIVQVVINLLSNANTHTPKGTVILRTSGKDGKVFLEVIDNGVGIAQEEIPHLFDRYYSQGEKGLGLPICKEVVEACGGDITIHSEVKKGTRVVVTFPTQCEEDQE